MKLFFSCLLALGMAVSAYGNTLETQVEQTPSKKGEFGEFRIWLPPDTHPDRILIAVWGANQCGLGIVDDPVWQQLAASLHCALMASFFSPQTPDNHWDHAEEGSGKSLLEGIQALARASGENRLADASFYLVGDSQGGEFALSFASWQPARTLGFVSLKGGRHDLGAVPNAARVPGLFFAGRLDATFRMANIREVFSKGRAFGAPWCLAVDPGGDHTPDSCAPLVRSYLEALSTAPLARKSDAEGASARPYLGSSVRFVTNKSWFPNTAFERDWAAFEAGKLKTSTPPLSFKSVMPPTSGEVAAQTEDLGNLESGQVSRPFLLTVTPNTETRWDELKVLDCPYLSDEKVVQVSSNKFAVSCRLSTSGLPLGRFAGVVPLRFKYRGATLLGGLNVAFSATVTGDVSAFPSLILLKTDSTGTESTLLQINSKKRQPISLLSYQAVPGVRVESSSKRASPLELTVSFDASKTSPSGLVYGSLLLQLKTDREWVLRLPYIVSSPRKDGSN